MERGRILKGIGGFYYVLSDGGALFECKARGRFRNDRETPMVGDYVHFENGLLLDIAQRKNALVRPPVANVDQLIVVLSLSRPKPDLLLADKLLIAAMRLRISPLIVLSKLDEADADTLAACKLDYGGAFPVLPLSVVTGEGLEALKARLAGKTTCLAGQSAVGKTSLVNALLPNLALETGDLSSRTSRGKHTTRRAELISAFGGYVVDTPGFSLFDADTLDQEALDQCYPEFGSAPEDCRFAACSHIAEPDCAVKKLVESGGMSPARYERYVQISKDFTDRRKHRYD